MQFIKSYLIAMLMLFLMMLLVVVATIPAVVVVVTVVIVTFCNYITIAFITLTLPGQTLQ